MKTAYFIALSLLCLVASVQAVELERTQVQSAAEYSATRGGLALLIIQKGQTLLSVGGSSHKIYSGTKGFWILAALAAEEDGLLKLEERVGETIGEWRENPRRSKITIRELLNFTSGLDSEFHLHSNQVPDRNSAALKVALVAESGQRFIYGPAALQVFCEVLKRKLADRGQTPIQYLERKVLKPLGLGAQVYRKDRAGNPLLASGFELTAEQWARMGRLILRSGSPVVSSRSFSECLRGTAANPAFGMGFWNNHSAEQSSAREFDIEDMLERSRNQQDWHRACICRSAPTDLIASIGSGYQRLFVIPSLDLVIVRQGVDAKFSDAEFLRILLGK